jgi:hypothetical protein
MAIIGAIGAVVALVSGFVELRAALRSDGTPIAATITRLKTIDPDVPCGRYYDGHPDVAAGPFSEDQLRRLGEVLTVELVVKGLKGKTGLLRWREIDRDGTELDVPSWVPRTLPIRPDQEASRFAVRVWVAVPSRVDEFRVEFGFDDHEGVTRATELSRRIRIGRF